MMATRVFSHLSRFFFFLQSPLKREKESSQPTTSSEPSSDSAYYGTADHRTAVVSRDYRDSVTRQDSKIRKNPKIRTISTAPFEVPITSARCLLDSS